MFCTVLLAVVFAIAAFGKVRSASALAAFRDGLAQFGVAPSRIRRSVAGAVIAAEVGVVVLLGVAPRAGFLLAIALLVVFSAGIANALRRGVAVACRCFGSSASPIGPEHLVRNALLVAVGVLGAAGRAPSHPALEAVTAVLGALAGVLVTRWDDLVYIARGPRRSHP